MRKIFAVFLVMAVILSLASCGLIPGKMAPSPSSEPSASASTDTPSAVPSGATAPANTSAGSAAAEFLAGEPEAAAVAQYLKQNAKTLLPGDNDLLLERLLLLQEDISAALNLKVWDTPYMSALNDTLGGVLDAGKIPDIKDNKVRSEFQAASDGMMTIVRYEETPVFETDWASLEAMKDVFGGPAAQMVTYQSRFQGRYYVGDPYNFDAMAEDIAAVEKLIGSTENGFVRWQLKGLYVRQVSRLLYGAEGTWLEAFANGDAQLTKNLKNYAEMYAGTTFGAICKRMLELQSEGMTALSAYIGDRTDLPPGDSRTLTRTKLSYNGAAVEYPQLTGLKDTKTADKINGAISDFAKALVKTGNSNQTVGYYLSFINDRYISFNFSYTYRNESDSDNYSEAYLTLDLTTGGTVTLDDLVGKPFDAYKDALLKAVVEEKKPASLTSPVRFMLNGSEMTLSVPSDKSNWLDSYSVTFNGLRSFMDVSKLY